MAMLEYFRLPLKRFTRNKNHSNIDSLKEELNVIKAQNEKLERELLAREELMQSMFSLLAEKKK